MAEQTVTSHNNTFILCPNRLGGCYTNRRSWAIRLPGVGSGAAKLINWLVLRQGRLFAWPNIWTQTEIVPEFVGRLQPEAIAAQVIEFLDSPEKLEEMRSRLRAVRGQLGAAQKLAQLVQEILDFD
jgi:hypothetical protein